MEKVQERALRFAYEDFDSSYDDLSSLQKIGLPSLHIRRMRLMGVPIDELSTYNINISSKKLFQKLLGAYVYVICLVDSK